MDWDHEGRIQNVAFVISADGEVLGMQRKNQLDSIEDSIFDPGSQRHIFTIDGVAIGISICHEGFRYPESVRWAAVNGAQLVIHPHCNGNNEDGSIIKAWGAADSPYFEKAMMCRALENTIYFASINYGFKFQESATSIIDPTETCIGYDEYNTAGLLGADLDLDKSTRLLAKRFSPERLQ